MAGYDTVFGGQADQWHLNCVRQCIFKTKKAGKYPKNMPDCLRLCAPYAFQGLGPHGPLSPEFGNIPNTQRPDFGGLPNTGRPGSPAADILVGQPGLGRGPSTNWAETRTVTSVGQFHGYGGQLQSPFSIGDAMAADRAHLQCVQDCNKKNKDPTKLPDCLKTCAPYAHAGFGAPYQMRTHSSLLTPYTAGRRVKDSEKGHLECAATCIKKQAKMKTDREMENCLRACAPYIYAAYGPHAASAAPQMGWLPHMAAKNPIDLFAPHALGHDPSPDESPLGVPGAPPPPPQLPQGGPGGNPMAPSPMPLALPGAAPTLPAVAPAVPAAAPMPLPSAAAGNPAAPIAFAAGPPRGGDAGKGVPMPLGMPPPNALPVPTNGIPPEPEKWGKYPFGYPYPTDYQKAGARLLRFAHFRAPLAVNESRPTLPSGWVRVKDSRNQEYFWEPRTNKTSWARPGPSTTTTTTATTTTRPTTKDPHMVTATNHPEPMARRLPDGTKEERMPGGIIIRSHPDGSREQVWPDGTSVIVDRNGNPSARGGKQSEGEAGKSAATGTASGGSASLASTTQKPETTSQRPRLRAGGAKEISQDSDVTAAIKEALSEEAKDLEAKASGHSPAMR